MHERDLEQVYKAIFQFVVEREQLPTLTNVIWATGLHRDVVRVCLRLLRASGRLKGFYPVSYNDYWRQHVRAEDTDLVRLAELPKTKLHVARSRVSKS